MMHYHLINQYLQCSIVFFLLIILFSYPSTAQVLNDSSAVIKAFENVDLTVYGRIEIGAGFDDNGDLAVSNNVPRAGFRLIKSIFDNDPDKLKIISKVEFGLDLVSRDETITFSPDPGAQVSQVGDAVFIRMGYVGVTYKDISIIIGKDNSLYYELGASEVDRFLAFGGTAIGVWNAGTDGGVSGTGRANQLIKLIYSTNNLKVGAQLQARDITDSNNKTVDTYGLGINYSIKGFAIGIGYNKVLDGVIDPQPNQANENDEAIVFASSYEFKRYEIAFSYLSFTKHEDVEVNEETIFYDGEGFEFYFKYKLTPSRKWHIATGFNYLFPKPDQNLDDYDLKFGLVELGYNFSLGSHVFISSKFDNSKNIDGSDRLPNLYGIGIRFAF
ncbi:MAG: porin [Bacteroidota bacterium]